jgi:hypothetical protein
MLTDISNTRNSNLFLTIALTAIIVLFLIFAAAPAISLGEPAQVAAPGASETGSDYYHRHPELRVSGAGAADDFYLRHRAWTVSAQPAAISVTGSVEASDYFQRHPELIGRPGMACESPVDCR